MELNLKIYNVTELHKEITEILREIFSSEIIVEGEITSFRGKNSSGHYYFSLKDNNSSINCVLFRRNSLLCDTLPKMGMKVRIKGKLETYSNSSSPSKYQIIVKDISEIGNGELFGNYLKLFEKLSKEGIFNKTKNTNFYKYPKCIGVITSKTGSVIKDIIKTINMRYPLLKIKLYSTKVQGKSAIDEILMALDYMENNDEIESIIIGRGGGSFEDLFIFNDERIVRKIYSMKKQIITSIGHDDNIQLCDLVSDFRASTPTQAGMIITPITLENIENELNLIRMNILKNYNKLISTFLLDIDYYFNSIKRSFIRNYEFKQINLINLEKQINSLSYDSILKKGFSITTDSNGKIINLDKFNNEEIKNLINQKIFSKLYSGSIESRIIKINK